MTCIERIRYRRKLREALKKEYGQIFWNWNQEASVIEFGTVNEWGYPKETIGYIECATDKVVYL